MQKNERKKLKKKGESPMNLLSWTSKTCNKQTFLFKGQFGLSISAQSMIDDVVSVVWT